MSAAFTKADRIFRNAEAFGFNQHTLPTTEPLEQFLAVSGKALRLLRESEAELFAPTVRLKLWRLRNTVLYSLLPFTHSSLELQSQLDEFIGACCLLTEFADAVQEISDTLSRLIPRDNPKRKCVIELLDEVLPTGDTTPIGIVTPPAYYRLPGWQGDIQEDIKSRCPIAEFISSRAELERQFYQRIIVPHGGYRCSFVRNVVAGYQTPCVDLVAYRREACVGTFNVDLPKTPATRQQAPSPPLDTHRIYHEKSAEEEDIEQEFWELKRSAALAAKHGDLGEDEGAVLIPARLVLLPEGHMVYLNSRKKELFGPRASFGDEEEGLCYRTVATLREGDYLVLRTGKSSDLVKAVADTLMAKVGEGELREKAFDWKPMLKAALRDLGHVEMVQMLEGRGVDVSPPAYIWAWTTDFVMRPGTRKRFDTLIRVIRDAKAFCADDPIDTYIKIRWETMDKVESYHRKAGRTIRQALLERLSQSLPQSDIHEQVYHTRLSDEFAGAEISVFQVLAVDTRDTNVPAGQIGRVLEGEGDSWQG